MKNKLEPLCWPTDVVLFTKVKWGPFSIKKSNYVRIKKAIDQQLLVRNQLDISTWGNDDLRTKTALSICSKVQEYNSCFNRH